jgi:hypothetical protein
MELPSSHENTKSKTPKAIKNKTLFAISDE